MKIARKILENLRFFCKKTRKKHLLPKKRDRKRLKPLRPLAGSFEVLSHFAAGRAMTASGSKSSGQNPMGL